MKRVRKKENEGQEKVGVADEKVVNDLTVSLGNSDDPHKKKGNVSIKERFDGTKGRKQCKHERSKLAEVTDKRPPRQNFLGFHGRQGKKIKMRQQTRRGGGTAV